MRHGRVMASFPSLPLEPADLDHLLDAPGARSARRLLFVLLVAGVALAWWLAP